MIKYIWLSFLLKIAVSSILTNVTQLHQLGQFQEDESFASEQHAF